MAGWGEGGWTTWTMNTVVRVVTGGLQKASWFLLILQTNTVGQKTWSWSSKSDQKASNYDMRRTNSPWVVLTRAATTAKLILQNVRPLYFRSGSAYPEKQAFLTLLSGSSTLSYTSLNTVLFAQWQQKIRARTAPTGCRLRSFAIFGHMAMKGGFLCENNI